MGLSCTLFRATKDELQRIAADPDALEPFVRSIEGVPPPMRQVRPKGFLGLLLRLTPITIWEPEPTDETPLVIADSDRLVDLDVMWEGVNFLLTRTVDGGNEPACFLVKGGETLDDDGICRALSPEETARFAHHLSSLSLTELERRFDAAAMRRLGIRGTADENASPSANAAFLADLLNGFTAVMELTKKAASAGDGLIVRIG